MNEREAEDWKRSRIAINVYSTPNDWVGSKRRAYTLWQFLRAPAVEGRKLDITIGCRDSVLLVHLCRYIPRQPAPVDRVGPKPKLTLKALRQHYGQATPWNWSSRHGSPPWTTLAFRLKLKRWFRG